MGPGDALSLWSRRGLAALAALGCAPALADGFAILDVGGYSDDAVTRIDARAAGRLYFIDGNCRVGSLAVAAAQPGDPGPRLTVFPLPRCSVSNTLLARPDGSFLTLGADSDQVSAVERVIARSAEGDVLFTSDEVGNGRQTTATALAVQSDGKIVVGGTRNIVGGVIQLPDAWRVTRLNANGTIDTSFSGGTVERDLGNTVDEYLRSVALSPAGQIVAVGPEASGAGPTFLGKFNDDGSPDFSFNNNTGLVTLTAGADQLGIDSSNRIYVHTAQDRIVTRVLDDGTLDNTYAGGTPRATLHITGLMLDSQQRAVAFGWESSGQDRTGRILRFTSDGDPDAAFGDSGEVEVVFPSRDIVTAQAALDNACFGSLQADDKPVIACTVTGINDPGTLARADIGIARFDAAGVLDPAFGEFPDSDTYPDDFAFTPVTVPFGTIHVGSDPVTISGINGPVSAVADEISIGCTDTFEDGRNGVTVEPDQTVCVRVNASAQAGGTAQTTLTVGGRKATFTVMSSNDPADTTPDVFTFTDQTNVATGTVITSNRITVTGIAGIATSNITGGEQSIECEPNGFTAGPLQVVEGTQICVRHTSSASFSTAVNTQVFIGGVTDTFTSTTQAAPPPSPPPPPSSGRSGGGGGMFDPVLAALAAALGLLRRRPRR